MIRFERLSEDLTDTDREFLGRIVGQKINCNQRILIKVVDENPSQKGSEECSNGQHMDNQAMWDAYSEASSEKAAKVELETIILDWASSSGASEEKIAEVRSLLLEHSYLLDLDI